MQELKNLAVIQFNFAPKTEALDYVRALASRMQSYPPQVSLVYYTLHLEICI